MDNTEQVKAFLRGQNLEQVGRAEEAIALYESVVGDAFDSTGPYDRLIALYSARAQHADVIRVADLAVAQVHTYDEKRDWYRRMKAEAQKAAGAVPKATPRPRP